MINKALCKLVAWWRIHFVSSKTLVFVWVFIFITKYVELKVASVLVDYIIDNLQNNMRQAAITSSLIEAALSLLVIWHRRSESYVGRFNVIIFYAGAYVTGLLLLLVGEACTISLLPLFPLFVASMLIVLGKSRLNTTLPEFLEYQLKEKVKQSIEKNSESTQDMDKEKEQELNRVRFGIWYYSAQIAGACLTFVLPAEPWLESFRVSALLMGPGYLIFYSGCIFYSFEKPKRCHEKAAEIPILRKIYRVYKAALCKRKLEYPASVDRYYWKNNRQNHFYSKRMGHVQFLPKAFGRLDKASIIREVSSLEPEEQEKNRKLCTVKEVREVKIFSSAIVLFCSLLAYGVMDPTETTFFVLQASSLRPDFNISFLFVMKLFIHPPVSWFFWWRKLENPTITKRRIFGGMVCSVLCCLTAWLVELRRLSSVKNVGNSDDMSVAILIPQFLLLGLGEALAEDGLAILFRSRVPESMWSFEEPLTEILFAIGKLLTLVFILIFSAFGWFRKSLNSSNLDWYYLWLAILNCVSLFIYGYYSKNHALNDPYPEDEELGTTETENVDTECQEKEEEEEDAIPKNPTSQEGLGAELPSSTMVASGDPPQESPTVGKPHQL